ncbi:hypothetical protein [Inquilinus sp. CAU 1745]|uniref:hypothetical protein n=1 Tax=Inquilinus sp. CAU 1745 TaxID=3140369 RepID=UPI00325B4C6D
MHTQNSSGLLFDSSKAYILGRSKRDVSDNSHGEQFLIIEGWVMPGGIEDGSYDYLSLPCSPEALAIKIGKWFDHERYERNLLESWAEQGAIAETVDEIQNRLLGVSIWCVHVAPSYDDLLAEIEVAATALKKRRIVPDFRVAFDAQFDANEAASHLCIALNQRQTLGGEQTTDQLLE